MKQPIAGIAGSKPRLPKPSGGNGKISRAESHALDVEYRKQRNQQLALKNNREQMALEQARGALIEKKTAIMQAGYLLSSFRQRVLQEPASLARLLVRGGFVEEARGLEVAESIRGDLCEMLDELASLPEKIAEAEWPNETIDLRPQVESDGDANPSEIRAERAKWRRRKMRKLHAKGASKS